MVHFCLQKFEAKCGPLIDPTVDRLLTLLFAPQNKKVANIVAETPICIVFLDKHTYKHQKPKTETRCFQDLQT